MLHSLFKFESLCDHAVAGCTPYIFGKHTLHWWGLLLWHARSHACTNNNRWYTFLNTLFYVEINGQERSPGSLVEARTLLSWPKKKNQELYFFPLLSFCSSYAD